MVDGRPFNRASEGRVRPIDLATRVVGPANTRARVSVSLAARVLEPLTRRSQAKPRRAQQIGSVYECGLMVLGHHRGRYFQAVKNHS